MNGRTDDPAVLTRGEIAALLPPRVRDSHKGMNGRLLLCVGSYRYTGAALLSAAAALRAGCGLLTVAVPGLIKPAFAALPEACCTAVNDGAGWDNTAIQNAIALLDGKQAVALGCGMDASENAALLRAAIGTHTPLVIDADGLNLLAQNRMLLESLHENVILTPHVSEMARLLLCENADVAADPAGIARQAARRFGCVVLLKGADTFLAQGECLRRNSTGNPGLAKGGSGDVLTGLIAGLLAQGLRPFDAACAGAFLLGESADTAYRLLGNRMLLAGDVIDAVRETIRAVE